MVVSEFRTDIPEWVKNNWTTRCPHCGAYIMDNSDTGVTTARWCVNPKCPRHMAYKAKEIAKFFDVKGVGPETLYNSIVLHKYTSHLDFIPVWFNGQKPLMSLSDIAVLACIEGYGKTQADADLSSYQSFEQYFNLCPDVNLLLWNNRQVLYDAEKYFTIKPPLSDRKIYVMGTGSFHGYSSRAEYFNMLNRQYGSYIHVVEVGKRKSRISYLLRENDAIDHSKTQLALDNGIPIVTPSEFIDILCSLIVYYDNMDKGGLQ